MNASNLPSPMRWYWALPALLLIGVLLVAYRDTLTAMVAIWARSETFAHAFLVPPIVVWLIWRKRRALAAARARPCGWMLGLMAMFAFAWLFGDLASINSVAQFSATALIVLAVPAVFGLQVARVIAFPLAFLFFAVPIGEFLLPLLMTWTADFTVFALRASGIPVFREGNQFVIPSGQWSVVEACSGVRYLIAASMVGTLFAYLNYRSTRRRVMFVAVAVAVAIVANWIRAYAIVMIGHLSDNRLAAGVDHLIYGWVFFGALIGLLFLIGSWWSEPDVPSGPAAAGASKAATTGAPRPGAATWATAIAAAVLVVTPHAALYAIGDVAPGAQPELRALNDLPGGWTRRQAPAIGWTPAFHNPSAELNTVYEKESREIGLYVGYYRQQDYQRKLVSSDNQLAKTDDPVWSRVSPLGTDSVDIGRASLEFRTATLRRYPTPTAPEQRLLVWQVYWVADTLTASDAWAKALAFVDRLRGRGDDAAAIVFYTDDDQPDRARAALASFVRANLDAIVETLSESRNGVRASIVARQSPLHTTPHTWKP